MRAQLSELVFNLFAECASIGNNDIFGLCKVTTAGYLSMAWLLIAAAVLGFLLASITFGLQIPAGIILPSLAIGALYGRAFGALMELVHRNFPSSWVFAVCESDVPCIIPGTYAIVGAASALAGVTRMTVSIVVIMFELTGALSYVLPIMIAVMLAKWIGDAFGTRGIYESWIQFKGYPFLEHKDDTQIPHATVSKIMTRVEEMQCLDASQTYTVEELQNLLRQANHRGFPVVAFKNSSTDLAAVKTRGRRPSQNNTFLGYISSMELAFALDKFTTVDVDSPQVRPVSQQTSCYFAHQPGMNLSRGIDLRPWMDQTPITLNANSSLQLAVHMFQNLGLRYLLFVDRGAFRGMLTKKDVWWILSASERGKDNGHFVAGTGALRDTTVVDDDGPDESRGLLRDDTGRGDGPQAISHANS
jgi:chloride channel 3/4/5